MDYLNEHEVYFIQVVMPGVLLYPNSIKFVAKDITLEFNFPNSMLTTEIIDMLLRVYQIHNLHYNNFLKILKLVDSSEQFKIDGMNLMDTFRNTSITIHDNNINSIKNFMNDGKKLKQNCHKIVENLDMELKKNVVFLYNDHKFKISWFDDTYYIYRYIWLDYSLTYIIEHGVEYIYNSTTIYEIHAINNIIKFLNSISNKFKTSLIKIDNILAILTGNFVGIHSNLEKLYQAFDIHDILFAHIDINKIGSSVEYPSIKLNDGIIVVIEYVNKKCITRSFNSMEKLLTFIRENYPSLFRNYSGLG
jgi:hypothetical protein